MVRKEIITAIERLYRNLEAGGFSPQTIYLFGSQATGAFHDGSDIDVMVVLPENLDLTDRRYGRAHGIAYRTDPRLEPWFIGKEDFEQLETPLISMVREQGQLIKAA